MNHRGNPGLSLSQFAAVVVGVLVLYSPWSEGQAATPPGVPRVTIAVQSGSPGGDVQSLTSPAVASEGTTAVLTAEVQGSPPLQFQWWLNGAMIPGATNPVYVLSALERADDGAYSVVVTNSSGRATSEPARLLISNVKPELYMGLWISAPTGNVQQIRFADSLATNANWTPLAGVPSLLSSNVIIDPESTQRRRRFYQTPRAQAMAGRIVPGWRITAPTGSVHTIEFMDSDTAQVNWQKLTTLSLTQASYLFVDTTVSNRTARQYRSTMVEAPSSRRVGRLVSAVKWILPPDVYTLVAQTNRQTLAALGVSLNDQEHALQMPTNALPGYWIVVGDQRVMTDTNGNFVIDVAPGITNGFAVAQQGDRSTEGDVTFAVNQLVLPGQVAPPIFVQFVRDGALNMDPFDGSAAGLAVRALGQDPVCGDPCRANGARNNIDPCCLDYDGLISDGCKYPESDPTSRTAKVIRYINSTCYRLVNLGLCYREGSSHAIGFRVSGLWCHANHKYRNCQNVDLNGNIALTLSSSALFVRCGESISLMVHNNSRANETVLTLEPHSRFGLGRLSGDGLVAGVTPESFTLRHYDDSVRMHLSDRVFHYTAPKAEELEPGVAEKRIQVRAKAGAIEQVIEITVMCGACPSDPAVVPIANMVSIPAGTFTMGSPASERERLSAEGPQTLVVITRGFCMGRHEVTQGEYAAVMGNNPSGLAGCSDCPVETVSWFDAVAYCAALTAQERSAGRLPGTWRYRLPTEAEWEYACRAETTTAFHYGSALRSGMANFYGYWEYESSAGSVYNPGGTYLNRTTAVGRYAPNAWGLYDMHGNVWEWCQDWWAVSLPGGSVTDPQGPATGSLRVIRGGGWYGFARDCRSADRFGYSSPGIRDSTVGFRVVLAPGQ